MRLEGDTPFRGTTENRGQLLPSRPHIRKQAVTMWESQCHTRNEHRVVGEQVGGALSSILGIRPRAQEMGLSDMFSVPRTPSASENSSLGERQGGVTSA